MTFTLEQIYQTIAKAAIGSDIKLRDDSEKHAKHIAMHDLKANHPTHVHIKITWAGFSNLSRLEQHKCVNKCLKPFFAKGLHSATMDLKAV